MATTKKTAAAKKAPAKTPVKQQAPTRAQRVSAGVGSAGKHSVGFFMSFVNFVREQGVVGLAVGLAIGTAAGASVKTIVDQLIAPLVGLLTRGVDLNSLKWVLISADPAHNTKEVAIGWGLIISSIITLVATALVVYALVHWARLDRMDRKKEEA